MGTYNYAYRYHLSQNIYDLSHKSYVPRYPGTGTSTTEVASVLYMYGVPVPVVSTKYQGHTALLPWYAYETPV